MGSSTPPAPAFSAPDTIYNSVWTTIFNATPSLKGEVAYQWSMGGSPISYDKDLFTMFQTDGHSRAYTRSKYL